MRSYSRKKVTGGTNPWEPISRGEPGGGSGISIDYKDIHMSSFGRKGT